MINIWMRIYFSLHIEKIIYNYEGDMKGDLSDLFWDKIPS